MKSRRKISFIITIILVSILTSLVMLSIPKQSPLKTMVNSIRQALGEGPTITVSGVPDNTPIRTSITITITATSDRGISRLAVDGVDIEHTNGVGTYTIDENGRYVITAVDGQGLSSFYTVEITQIDKTPPEKTAPEATSTLDSITVTFKQTDSGSGISNNKNYRLTDVNGNTGTWMYSNENQYTFTGLEDGVVYYVQTKAEDAAGNLSTSDVTAISTKVPPLESLVTVTKTPETAWAKQVIINVTISDNGKYQVLTSTDGTSFTEATRIVVEENTKVYAKLVNGDAQGDLVEIAEVTNADNIPPTNTAPSVEVTANKITVTNNQEDTLSGLDTSKTRYRLLADAAAETVVRDWQASNVFTELDSETDYYVQTKSEDILGNTSFSQTKKATTQAILSGSSASISYNTQWTNQDVVVTVTNPSSEYTMEISLDGTTWNITSPITFEENGVIYTRFTDGRNYGTIGERRITNIDKIPPTDDEPTVIATENSLSITSNQTDEISGIEVTEYRFATDEAGSSSLPGYDWSTTRDYRNLPPNTTFYVQTRTRDKANNTTLSKVKVANTTPIPTTAGVLDYTAEPSEGWTKSVVISFVITDENLRTRYRLEISADGQNYSEPDNQTIVVTENGPIYTRFTDGTYNGNGYITYRVENIDNNPPTMTAPTGETTEEKITITSNQVDNESGLKKTWYRLAADSEGTAALQGKDWQESNTFTGLTANTTYYLQTKAEDNLGNISESLTTEMTTWVVPSIDNLTLVANPSGVWTANDVTVVASYSKRNFQVQLSLDGTNYETADSIIVPQNGIVYGRFINGDIPGTEVTTITILNIDKTAPTTSAPEADATTRKITVTNKQNDDQSGIRTIEYRLATDSEGTESLENYDWKDSPIFDELEQNTTYYVQTRAEDGVGNFSESEILEISTATVEPAPRVITLTQDPTVWTKDSVTVTAEGESDEFDIEMSTDGDNYTVTQEVVLEQNKRVYARFTDGVNSGEPVDIDIQNIDKTPPTTTAPEAAATQTRITVTNKQTDNQSGIDTGKTRYMIRLEQIPGNELDLEYPWQESNIFDHLPSNRGFYVKTKSIDNVGNESESEETYVVTEEIPAAQGNITYEKTPSEWTNGNVFINFENSQTSYQIEYSTDGEEYTLVSENEIVISENCTIYVRLTNGISHGREMPIIINNIDKAAPRISISSLNITYNSIEVIADASDTLSGIKEIKYLISETDPSNVSISNTNWKSNGLFKGLEEETLYFIRVAAIDNAGNIANATTTAMTKSRQTEITSEEYGVLDDEEIITKVPLHTLVDDFKDRITVNQDYIIVDKDGEEITSGEMKTGYKVKTETAEYEVAVTGDIAPNGNLDVADLARMRSHLVGFEGKILTGVNYYAADIDNNGTVNIIDLSKIRKRLVE